MVKFAGFDIQHQMIIHIDLKIPENPDIYQSTISMNLIDFTIIPPLPPRTGFSPLLLLLLNNLPLLPLVAAAPLVAPVAVIIQFALKKILLEFFRGLEIYIFYFS